MRTYPIETNAQAQAEKTADESKFKIMFACTQRSSRGDTLLAGSSVWCFHEIFILCGGFTKFLF